MQRTRLAINAGNLLELIGAGLACYAVADLVGVGWSLLLAAVLILVAAELAYSNVVWRLPLPHRPKPRVSVKERQQKLLLAKTRYRYRFRAWRADRRLG